eukprot:UN4337
MAMHTEPQVPDSTEQESHEPGDFEVILALHSHYATWWFSWCRICQRVSGVFTWLAMAFNVLCSSILLGMYFQYSYPDTPEMWRWYSYLVLLGLLAAMVLTGLSHLTGPRLAIGSDLRSRHIEQQKGAFIPGWMKEDCCSPFPKPLIEA